MNNYTLKDRKNAFLDGLLELSNTLGIRIASSFTLCDLEPDEDDDFDEESSTYEWSDSMETYTENLEEFYEDFPRPAQEEGW